MVLLPLRVLAIEKKNQDPTERKMRSNFVPHPSFAGEGRCRVCDLPYSQFIDKEVAQHRRYHARFLIACDTVGAPVPEATRDSWRQTGMAIQNDPRLPLKDRVAAAEAWLLAEHHEHLFAALLYVVKRLDVREYFTKRVEMRGFLANFEPDVAAELRLRYSDGFVEWLDDRREE
jgi:hypothetical protein